MLTRQSELSFELKRQVPAHNSEAAYQLSGTQVLDSFVSVLPYAEIFIII